VFLKRKKIGKAKNHLNVLRHCRSLIRQTTTIGASAVAAGGVAAGEVAADEVAAGGAAAGRAGADGAAAGEAAAAEADQGIGGEEQPRVAVQVVQLQLVTKARSVVWTMMVVLEMISSAASVSEVSTSSSSSSSSSHGKLLQEGVGHNLRHRMVPHIITT